MSDTCCGCEKSRVAAYVVGVGGTFLIMAALAWLVIDKTRPPGLDQEHVALRRKNLTEMRALDKDGLASYGSIDPAHGIVRLPIEQAMDLTLTLWQNPAAGRSNLLSRIDKATAKLPDKPNPYE